MNREPFPTSFYAGLGISAEGITIIERVRHGLPVRNTVSGGQTSAGCFMSEKMQVGIGVESRTLEMAYTKKLDFDDTVLEFYEQAHALRLKVRRADGQMCGFSHVPDFLVIRRTGVAFEELKPWSRLEEKAKSQPERFVLNERSAWYSPPAEAALAGTGIQYLIVTDRDINPVLIRNINFLADFRRAK